MSVVDVLGFHKWSYFESLWNNLGTMEKIQKVNLKLI